MFHVHNVHSPKQRSDSNERLITASCYLVKNDDNIPESNFRYSTPIN